MSGSGSGGGSYGGGYGGGGGSAGGGAGGTGGAAYVQPIPCDKLRVTAQLTSPQAAVVPTLTVGDVLDVVLATLQGASVIRVERQGVLVGGITGPDAAILRGCIAQGHQYKATVQSIVGGQVRVLVEHL